MVAGNSACCTNGVLVFGVFQMMLGIGVFSLDIVVFTSAASSTDAVVYSAGGSGVWSGIMYFTCGLLAVTAAVSQKRKSVIRSAKCRLTATLVTSVVATLACCGLAGYFIHRLLSSSCTRSKTESGDLIRTHIFADGTRVTEIMQNGYSSTSSEGPCSRYDDNTITVPYLLLTIATGLVSLAQIIASGVNLCNQRDDTSTVPYASATTTYVTDRYPQTQAPQNEKDIYGQPQQHRYAPPTYQEKS